MADDAKSAENPLENKSLKDETPLKTEEPEPTFENSVEIIEVVVDATVDPDDSIIEEIKFESTAKVGSGDKEDNTSPETEEILNNSQKVEDLGETTDKKWDSPIKTIENLETSPNFSFISKNKETNAENNLLVTQKNRKTYENRKNSYESTSNFETSPEIATTSSLNTSRYGRARKPKITEDFYNIEDIFGPYERITSSSPRRKSHKLDLSPNKSKDTSINLQEIKPIDLDSVLSIDIPDDNTEVSKVMKLVSNNSEFPQKSPSYSSKSIKTYGNKTKKILESHEYSFINGVKHDEISDNSLTTKDSVNKSDSDNKTSDTHKKTVWLFSDDSYNSSDSSINESQINKSPIKKSQNNTKRTKSKLSLKKNVQSSENSSDSSDDDLIIIVDKKIDSTNRESLNKSSDNSLKIDLKNKKLKKVHKDLNIGEFKSGRLRSSIAENEIPDVEIIKEVKIEEKIEEKPPKKIEEVITIDDTDEVIEEPHSYAPEVGELAWSRVGSYPFWPSIVTNEPGTTRHCKNIVFGRKTAKVYHVHFFGDNGRRSWVLGTHIFPFTKRSDLEIMAQSVSKDSKPKDPKHLSAFIINPNKLKKWETAVTEAENITDSSSESRIQKFFDLVSPKKKAKKRPFPSSKSPKSDISHKKIKLDKKSLSVKKFQKKTNLSKNFLPKSLMKDKKLGLKPKDNKNDLKIKVEDSCSIKSSSPSIKEEPIDDKTKNKIKNKLNKLSSKTSEDFKIISEDSYSDSETKDTSVTIKQERETPSPLPQISALQRHKRINLFRGITKERVCQVCGKNKYVYKCKGNCFGLYHIECDKKVRLKVMSKLAEEKSSTASSEDSDLEDKIKKREEIEESRKNVEFILEEILENVFSKTDDTVEVKQEDLESQEDQKKEEDTKLNRTLSLAEQIDLKMQEVMQDLITETKYSDSTTDEENEEISEIIIDPFQVKSSQSQASISEISQSEINKINFQELPHFEKEEMGEKEEKEKEENEEKSYNSEKTIENKSKVRKVIKHVTADGCFDVIEEEEELPPDYSTFKCAYCSTGVNPPCYICNKELSKSGDDKTHRCFTQQCGKYYHSECLKDWPQTKWNVSSKSKQIENETLCCPYHNCHTCISDNPRGPLSKYTNEKLAKCIRCPTTYHSSNYCIPAGTEILSHYQLICPKHLQTSPEEEDPSSSPSSRRSVDSRKSLGKNGGSEGSKKNGKSKIMPHFNASWCFICSTGGSLICCETCPSSFHVECLKLVPPEGRYLCEECESGRLPLYDEIVWVKLGSYRWWPAQILYPNDIPPNVASIPHSIGEFVVRFFGSHDHYWVNRGRVFLFQEGDTGHASSKKSAVDGLFVKAIKEATSAHKKFVEDRENRAAETQNGMRPPSYVKIKVNRPVGNVRATDADTSNTTPCDCDPSWKQPCGPDSDCLNRILLTECNPMVCAAGSRCCNQSFEKRLYAPVAPFKTTGRGWGLKTLAPVKKGAFVIEYVGELIDEKEYHRRMKRKHEQKDENYYFLTIDKDRMIDAGPKGNVARFMNHSCSPNCETQKWTVNGDTRVGLFAITDIPTGAELTFNYNLECIGEEKKECRCGAPRCSGFIGVKAKPDELAKKRKSVPLKHKKKKSFAQEAKLAEVITCFVCGRPDAIQSCDREACNKFYHLNCANLENFQEGKWLCPCHNCNICTKRTTRCCYKCTNSYCPIHSHGNIRYDRVKGFVCTEHDLRLRRNNRRSSHKYKVKEVEIKDIPVIEDTEKLSSNNGKMSQNKDYKDIKPKDSKPPSSSPLKISTGNEEIEEEIKHSASVKKLNKDIEEKKKSKIILKKKMNKIDNKKEGKEVNNGGILNKTPKTKLKKEEKVLKENTEKPNQQASSTENILQTNNSEESSQNNTSVDKIYSIKKRKSRLSLKKINDSSNASYSSSEDEPLVKLKKIKLTDEKSLEKEDKKKFDEKKSVEKKEENIKTKAKENPQPKQKPKALRSDRSLSQTDLDSLKSSGSNTKLQKLKSLKTKKPKRSLSLTDFDYSETSDSDFVPKKIHQKKEKTLKKTKISVEGYSESDNTIEEKKSKKLRNSLNSSIIPEDKTVKEKSKIKNNKEETEKKIPKLKNRKEDTPKYIMKKLKPSTSKSYQKAGKSNEDKLERKLKKTNLKSLKLKSSGKDKLKTFKAKVPKVDVNTPKNEDKNLDSVEAILDLSASKSKSAKKLQEYLKLRQNNPEKPKVTLAKLKSLQNLKQFRCSSSSESTDYIDETTLDSSVYDTSSSLDEPGTNKEEEKININTLSPKKKKLTMGFRKSLRNYKKEQSFNQEEKQNEAKQNEANKQDETNQKDEANPQDEASETEEESETENAPENEEDQNKLPKKEETTSEALKRKRGRPRKYPQVKKITSESSTPFVKRPKGRPRKIKSSIEEPQQNITELYKMKLNTEIIPKPYENHVNEVKLTAAVPARHLRVVLRKNSEIDSKIDNKFLKMQNDMERDLPIRKRSKLRYEAQL